MKAIKYRWIFYLITIVILATICVQVYWNYKNYLSNKQQLINDVQLSLDNAVETYFADLAETNTLAFAFNGDEKNLFSKESKLDSIINNVTVFSNRTLKGDSLDIEINEDIALKKSNTNTIIKRIIIDNSESEWHSNKIVLKKHFDSVLDSSHLFDLKTLTSKVLISMTSDSLKLSKIDSLVKRDLKRKQLDIDFNLSYKNDLDNIINTSYTPLGDDGLILTSKSNYLPKHSYLVIHFTNETKIILKRILFSILISTLLVLAVISCLFYLLKIIREQKQLAEIKNDLISNITHEFKTPIATIGVAIESIKSFNAIDNKEKTKTYLDISNNQLSKLNIMVEKLLETATLDSENLELVKEPYNIVDIFHAIVEKHSMHTENRTITFNTPSKHIMANIDVFHFENAINNILDNAIKYGGDTISVNLSQNPSAFTVSISDNGNTLTKVNKDKIFEKFYRIPKGNTHDIKGFGIGLYYTKKIAEKHGGTIHLSLNNKLTTFKITLPNE
ncbi:hypothetical protein GCM10023311_05730 [Flaviramulus aquimarinus]|uniref:histidine kinase n=1 Tax=Flaviramulus aquimarinus TaxID=1170456 RepID=A0ABP9F173_9FLAO